MKKGTGKNRGNDREEEKKKEKKKLIGVKCKFIQYMVKKFA